MLISKENNIKITFFKKSEITKDVIKKFLELKNHSLVTGRKSSVDIKSIKDPRIIKLAHLVEKYGKASVFASEVGFSNGNLSMILRGKKPFGKLAARRMEERLGFKSGWFDIN